MNYQPLAFFSTLGVIGYVVFHGHRLNQDCWLCPWRGLAFAGSSFALGALLAYKEE